MASLDLREWESKAPEYGWQRTWGPREALAGDS